MICEFTKKEKIVPPASESEKDRILAALGYEEQTVEIGGQSVTMLVKCAEQSVVGTAVVGTAIAGTEQ